MKKSLHLRWATAGAVFMAIIVLGAPPANAAPSPAPQDQQAGGQAGQAAAEDHRYWTTNWNFDDIDVGDVLGRLRSFGVDIPLQADGKVTVQFAVSVPLDALRDGSAYKFTGIVSSSNLRVEQLSLRDLRATLVYANGELKVPALTTRWIDRGATPVSETVEPAITNSNGTPGGLVNGSVNLQLIPRGNLTGDVTVDTLAVAPIYDLFLGEPPDAEVGLRGLLSGQVAFAIPLGQVADVSRWNLNANLRGERFAYADTPPLTIQTGPVQVEQGRVTANSIRLESTNASDVRLAASIQLNLTGDRSFSFAARGNDVPVGAIASLASLSSSPPVTGQIDLDLQGEGQLGAELSPNTSWDISGRLASPGLSVMGFDLGILEHDLEFNSTSLRLTTRADVGSAAVLVEQIAADYQLAADAIVLDQLTASLLNGTLSGSARVATEETGEHQLNLRWSQLQPRISGNDWWLPDSVEISAITSGQIDWAVPAADVASPAAHQGTAAIQVEQLLLNESSLGNASLTLAANEGELQLSGEGALFGGTFNVETSTTVADEQSFSDLLEEIPLSQDAVSNASLSFTSIQIAALDAVLNPLGTSRPSGFISGSLRASPRSTADGNVADTGEPWTVLGTVTLDAFSWQGTALSRSLSADLSWDGSKFSINNLIGDLAGGRIRGEVSYLFGAGSGDAGSGHARLRVSSASLDDLLVLFVDDGDQWGGGRVSGEITAALTHDLRARGHVRVSDSRVASFAMGDARAQLIATAARDLSQWSAHFESISSSLRGGQLTGDAKVRSASARTGRINLESRWKARRFDFTRLVNDVDSPVAEYARGQIDGEVVLNGRAIRSAADLTGSVNARLGNTDARAVPGLISTQSYLGSFALAGTEFDSGRLRGTFRSGAFLLNDFWLLSDRARVAATGSVNLTSGRLDIAALVSTGNFEAQNLALTALGETAWLPTSAPITLLIRLNQILSNRDIYVDVVGSLRDPRVRVRALRALREATARVLLQQALSALLPVPAIVPSGGGGDN